MWIHKAVCDECWPKETKGKVQYEDKQGQRRHACGKHGEALAEQGVETTAVRHGVRVID